MTFQKPTEIPKPEPSPPDQQFGQYSLEYFLQDSWWFILGIIIILAIVFTYSYIIRRRRNKE